MAPTMIKSLLPVFYLIFFCFVFIFFLLVLSFLLFLQKGKATCQWVIFSHIPVFHTHQYIHSLPDYTAFQNNNFEPSSSSFVSKSKFLFYYYLIPMLCLNNTLPAKMSLSSARLYSVRSQLSKNKPQETREKYPF